MVVDLVKDATTAEAASLRTEEVDLIDDPALQSHHPQAHSHHHPGDTHYHHHHPRQPGPGHAHPPSDPNTVPNSQGDDLQDPPTPTPAEADHDEHKFDHIVVHKGGFVRSQIEEAFTNAGLSEFEWTIVANVPRAKRTVQLFLAMGSPA